ncbi:MAG: M13 family metallopeptidase [Janthinobacterium lividum]
MIDRFFRTALLLAGGLALTAAGKPTFGDWGFDLTAMDRTVRPGDDFNAYASGAWNARTPIPADKSIVSLRTRMGDTIESRLHDLLASASSGIAVQPTTEKGKLGAFYAAFLNADQIETLGAKPIANELGAIRGARDRSALAELMGQANSDFYGSLFNLSTDADLKDVGHYAVYASQAGIGLPDRDYYLEAGFAKQRQAYQIYVARMLTLAGWPDATARAADVVAFETRVAEASWTKAQQRDIRATYNPQTVASLQALAPGFDWKAFLKGAGLGSQDRIIIAEQTAFPKLAAMYAGTPLETLKAWQAFTVIDNAAFYLSSAFADARFAFRDGTLQGQPEEPVRWKRGIRAVGGGDCLGQDVIDCFGHMDFGLGQLYVATWFPQEAKVKIQALVVDIKAAMRERISKLDWMGPATRVEALRKLDTYQIKVGYPDHPRDYSGLIIRSDDVVGDVRRSAAWNWRFYVDRLDGPVDRSDWSMTPQTNDAYNGSLRDIVFPAGILQAPMFDPAADPAINYGAIGGVIGHELTHGFDDEGRKLDASGQLRDWWTTADAAAFEARAKMLGAQYSSYQPVPGAHVNGDMTMGENIADLGGLTVALDAYRRSLHGTPTLTLGGFTGEQRVFLGWAQAWRGHAREDYLRKQVVTDPHSPRAFRVDGPTRNIDAWYDAFGVGPGQTYYVAPTDRVRIW